MIGRHYIPDDAVLSGGVASRMKVGGHAVAGRIEGWRDHRQVVVGMG